MLQEIVINGTSQCTLFMYILLVSIQKHLGIVGSMQSMLCCGDLAACGCSKIPVKTTGTSRSLAQSTTVAFGWSHT